MARRFNKWKLIKSEETLDLNIFKIRFDYYKNPRNNKEVKTIALSGADSANVIAKTPEGKIILAKQFRFGIGDYTLEIPGGMIEKGESIQKGAAREMREETGFEGVNWHYLGNVQSNPVFMDSLVHHFYMEEAILMHDKILDDAEDVELVFLSPKEVYYLIDSGSIRHPHTISAFFLARKLLLS